jgi:hypothetical protein
MRMAIAPPDPMREREDDETRADPVRAPQPTKPEPRERDRQRLAKRLETDPDDPAIVRGVD